MIYTENKYTMRDVTEDLLKDVLEIYSTNEEYFIISSNEKPSVQTIMDDKSEIPPNSKLEKKNYKLILKDDRSIGIIDYVIDYPDEQTIYIGLLLIHGEFHRQGYGREFIEQFISSMKKDGYLKIRLGVLKQNHKAFEFWTKMGFNLVKEIRSTIKPEKNWEIRVMEMIL